MRPVRFVALSEDGQAMVLADEVGRLLTLPIDDRVSAMLRPDRSATRGETSTPPRGAYPEVMPLAIVIRSGVMP